MQDAKVTKPKKDWKRELLEWGIALGGALVVALLIRQYIFSPYRVDGASMNDTLAHGEIMFTTKYDYIAGDPQRFDVVICRYPNRTADFVKRVVGIPGDTVAVQGGYLYVNGTRYEEDYITHRPNYEMAPYTVQPGEYFVLGDNRSNSNDSHLVGPITRSQIVAHVRAVLFPFNGIRGIH